MNLTEPTRDPSSPLSSLPRRDSERSRRRRRGHLHIPEDAQGRAALLASLAHRAYPTYELFVFAGLSGAILALGYLMDSQALLVFGALVAPLLLPWVGLLLGTVTGSLRFFFETLMAILLAAVLVFLIGLLAGFASRALPPRTFDQAFVHGRLWWPDLIILALGAVILTISFVRSEAKPFLPSVVLAYELFLPLAAGGFGLGSGIAGLWPHGVLVLIVNFAWASVFGLITLLALRIAPPSAGAFIFTAAVGLVLVAVLVVLMSGGNWTGPLAAQVAPPGLAAAASDSSGNTVADAPAPAGTQASSAALVDATPTPIILTPEPTNPPAATPTITMTIEPTPVYAQVNAPRGGAVLRAAPGGDVVTTLDNFTYVQVLPEKEDLSGFTWLHVFAMTNGERQEGWIVQQYLQAADTPPATPTP